MMLKLDLEMIGVGNEDEVRYCDAEYEVLDESLNEQSE